MAHPGTGEAVPKTLVPPITLAIGPEGGWIEAEVQSLLKAGLCPLDLGPRILRTETALAALVGKLF
jgi:RsmE family RNA methyltransferase